ncbi:MAG: hypothetical protein HC799_19575 [Limnothrix sp. RL_2_0]|nr:hypothetical protein [Limnothrix sp. RL_2_0]
MVVCSTCQANCSLYFSPTLQRTLEINRICLDGKPNPRLIYSLEQP